MKNKEKRWQTEVTTLENSHDVQTLAFNHGYKWVGTSKAELIAVTGVQIQFDTNLKLLLWTTIPNPNLKTAKSYTEILQFLKNPPVEETEKFNNFSVYKDGTVNVCLSSCIMEISSNDFDAFVAKRNEFLGKAVTVAKKRLPSVRFYYRKDYKEYPTYRVVAVTNLTSTYLEGYDLNDSNRFKRFLMEKVAHNGIQLVDFVDEP